MKKGLVAALASALVFGAGAGVSFAYLTAKDAANNQFRVSSVEIGIEEKFVPPGALTPGGAIQKSPKVRSASDTDCYVRVAVRFTDSDAEQACEPLAIGGGWQKKEDGYYYWGSPLRPGEVTGAVFDQVKIRQNAAKIPPFDILVYAEAVYCNGKTMEEAWGEMT